MKKYTVVGQGLAGTVLSFLLIKKGFDISIVDRGHSGSASSVAGGMWNPVSFKRVSVDPLAACSLETMRSVYREMEEWLGSTFFHERPLVRVFPDRATANQWDEKSGRPMFLPYTGGNDADVPVQIRAPYGTGQVSVAGWLEVKTMIGLARARWLKEGRLSEDNIRDTDGRGSTIWCTGNAWSREGPYRPEAVIPNKGELLHLEMDELSLEVILNFGKFLIPAGGTRFVLGATYGHGIDDDIPTEAARGELLSSLEEVIMARYRVRSHLAGIRPTTRDRYPLVGPIPGKDQVYIFNGFGSRGVLFVPWCAMQLAEHLANGAPLPKLIATERLK
ncbi:MAG: FAD-binding oxidoreductase [Flavobacteriales bacterium]|nr:FAD-binding oxidoreductase [Flavobacteriales bacterium]